MMERVVLDFLASLAPEQRARARFSFDARERFDWHYIPKERRGIPLKEMNAPQHLAAMAILRAVLSERGLRRSEDIMRLETVVAEIEGDDETYHPANYVFTIFGDPGNGAPWAWRVDGHHLSLNVTHLQEGAAVTPNFYGAHPATVEQGELRGLRVLGAEEHLGRTLIRNLDEGQRAQALIRARAFDDILTGPGREQSLREPQGLALGAMSESHRAIALAIIEQFIGTWQPALAQRAQRRLRDAGIERIHFGWAGALEPRQPHYYRLHGPSLVIEYDNTQNDANHIHSVWHDPADEFGTDLLRRHYEHTAHRGKPHH